MVGVNILIESTRALVWATGFCSWLSLRPHRTAQSTPGPPSGKSGTSSGKFQCLFRPWYGSPVAVCLDNPPLLWRVWRLATRPPPPLLSHLSPPPSSTVFVSSSPFFFRGCCCGFRSSVCALATRCCVHPEVHVRVAILGQFRHGDHGTRRLLRRARVRDRRGRGELRFGDGVI